MMYLHSTAVASVPTAILLWDVAVLNIESEGGSFVALHK